MSDTQTQSYTPAPTTTRRTGMSVWVWALVLLVAIAALAAAVWWAGGIGAAEKLLGLNNLSVPSFSLPSFGGGGSAAVAPAPAPATVASAPVLPPQAQTRLFVEQVQDREELSGLVGGEVYSISLGTPVTSDQSATVPITATYRNGSVVTGQMKLAKYNNLWYFFSIGRNAAAQAGDTAAVPESFDSGVVSTITQQQAQAGTQEMIVKGILGGGYRLVKIDGVRSGPRTATIDVSLSGGSEPATTGRFVCISKVDAGTTYWFVASFEKR